MSLSILVTIEVTAGDDERLNGVKVEAGLAEGALANIRQLANEAASRAEAAVGADRPPQEDDNA